MTSVIAALSFGGNGKYMTKIQLKLHFQIFKNNK